MFLPYTARAVYHWPIATIGLIVLNTAILFAWPGAAYTGYALDLGAGLHPVQWVTHNFLHSGPGHLTGNMIFLWVFGMIVEGKIGALAYLAIYLLIGICHGASVQLACLFVEPRQMLGSSAVIFGLMAISMVWAPKNEIQCLVVIFGFRGGGYADTWDIPILRFAIFYIGWQFVSLALCGLTAWNWVTSAMAHLSGAMWGMAVGVGMFKLRWVDCENWDLFAVLAGRQGASKVRPSRSRPVIFEADHDGPATRSSGGWEKTPETRAADSIRRIEKRFQAGDPDAVREAYLLVRSKAAFEPAETILIDWIKRLQTFPSWKPSIPLMRDYIRRFPIKAARVRLRLAQTLAKDQRPTHALRELEQIAAGSLPSALEATRRQLEIQCREMQEDGVLELDGDD